MKRPATTVTNGSWSVSSVSGHGIDGHKFQPHRQLGSDWRNQLKPECYGKTFKTSGECAAYALAQGFTRVYYSRPNLFINLRLSPATRKHLKSLRSHDARWAVLEQLTGLSSISSMDYIRAMRKSSVYRTEWILYMETGYCPLLDPRNRKLSKALHDWRLR